MTLLALGRGVSAIFRPRLLLVFYLTGLLVAAIVVLPYQEVLDDSIARLPDPAAKAAQVEPLWFEDFRRQRAPTLAALANAAGAATWLYLFLSTVLVGGAIAAFDRRSAERRAEEGRSYSYRVFFADAGRWALPMLRMLALSLPLFYLLDLAVNDWLREGFQRLFADRESERLGVITEWIRQGVFLVALLGLATVFDLARARTVIERRRSVLLALSASVVSMARRPGPVAVVACAFMGAELALMAVASSVVSTIETSSFGQLATWFLATQVLVLLRIGLGLGRLAAYATLAEDERDESGALALAA